MPRRVDLAALEAEPYLVLLRAILLVWHDVRDRLLCSLSADDGEWPGEDTKAMRGHLREMKTLMRLAVSYSEGLVEEESVLPLIWNILDHQAKIHGYTREINRSSNPAGSSR